MKKKCKDCQELKDISEFSKANGGKSINSYCKKCASTRSKQRYNNLPEEVKKEAIKRISAWQKKHLLEILENRKIKRRQNLNHKEKIWYNKRFAFKYLNDINFRLASILRHRIYLALKNNTKSDKTLNLLSCSLLKFRNYLESKFTIGMSWQNQGEWHVDHVIPCASFDLSNIEEQKVCFHYTNLQPLWAADNLKKRDK